MALDEKFDDDILKIAKFRFASVGQALSFYTRHIPVRAKPINMVEPEARGCDFDPEDVWLRLAFALERAMRGRGREGWKIFALRYGFSGDRNKQFDFAEIDEELRLRKGHARKVIRKILDELEERLIAAELMEPRLED